MHFGNYTLYLSENEGVSARIEELLTAVAEAWGAATRERKPIGS
jgi:hypothetical protein